MKVALLTPSAYPLGGVAVWLDYLCAGLPAHGIEPRVLLAEGRHHAPARYQAAYPALSCRAIANPTGSSEGRVRAIAQALEIERPDCLVVVNIVDGYEAVARLRAARPAQAPRVVMALHALEPELYGDARRERGVLDGVVATNRLSVRLLHEVADLVPARVHYAGYGVALEGVRQAPAVRAQGPLRVLYVGRLDQAQKRVRELPAVLAALDRQGADWRLDLAGDGPERARLHAALAPYGERVRWLGAVAPAQLAREVYAGYDALLVLSRWETGPIVAWEAMAAGLPVVSAHYLGSGAETALVHEHTALMFTLGDSDAAARQLLRTLEPAWRAQLARSGRELVAARYTHAASVAAWAAALHAVLQAPPLAPVPRAVRPAQGRLDRWLGIARGEQVRRRLGLTHAHANAGGEWPHTHGIETSERDAFWREAQRLDADTPEQHA